MKISAPFTNGEMIPVRFSCQGQGVSPKIGITEVPPSAKSLALIMDDPDAPMGTFVHWVIWNIPPDINEVPEGAMGIGVVGSGSMNRLDYTSPCPPIGDNPHRYFFKAYALDAMLNLKPGSSKYELENAMRGHIIESAEIIGKFKR